MGNKNGSAHIMGKDADKNLSSLIEAERSNLAAFLAHYGRKVDFRDMRTTQEQKTGSTGLKSMPSAAHNVGEKE